MRPYRFFYAIAPTSPSARWFDALIKVDRTSVPATVVARWSYPGVYLTEADFVPRATNVLAAPEDVAEDDGVLISILYNATVDESRLAFFDAQTLSVVGIYPIDGLAVPFHAHGIVCLKGRSCFPNP